MSRELSEAHGATPVCVAVAGEVLQSVKHATGLTEKRVERNLVELSVATQTPAHLGNAALYNFMISVEGAIRSVVFSFPQEYENNVDLSEGLKMCVKVQTMICSLLGAAMVANSSATQHFRSAILPLYQPSAVLDQTLGAKK